jgi:dTDP-4-amino-4,6-dideoxygalactose transaminase
MIKMIYPSKVWVDKDMRRAVEKVFDSKIFVMGKYTNEFEKKFSEHMNVKHAIALSNGTAAIEVSLQSLNITHDDEIIVPSHTAFPTVEAILKIGAKPVFVDIEESTYNMDISKIEKKITKKTKAILPVHLYGHPCDMGGIKEIAGKHSLKVIDDCAQSPNAEFKGVKVGSLGDTGCFSFYPSKNMTVCGEGGMITTNDDSVAEMARKLINHGQDGTYNHVLLGHNYRLGEIQCAIGLKQLEMLDSFTQRRRQIAKLYEDLLSDSKLVLPQEAKHAKHAYHLYVVRCDSNKRKALLNHMKHKGVICGIHYPLASHQQKVISSQYVDLHLPITEKIVNEIFSLPIYPLLKDDKVEMIVTSLKEFY